MSGSAPRLSIHLLGAPDVQVVGSPLTLNNQKARALLYYLAATGRPHTRDHLAALLWSESSDSDARHSLRSDLYRLKQALRPYHAETALISDGELVALRPGEYDCDAIRFRELVSTAGEGGLGEAVALYHGSLLEGFSLTDAPLFDEWLRFEESALSRDYVQALDRLASWAESRQAWLDAIGYVQRIVQLDPLSEDAQQRLIGLYVRRHAVGSALRQYQEFEAVLKRELGVTPSIETRTFVDEALRQRHDATPYDGTPRQPLVHASPALPFVGREQLLARLRAMSDDSLAGHGTAALLQGEAGVGKTRLVNELADRLSHEPSRWLILRGSCSPFDDLLSYGPFLEAFQNAAAGDLTGLLTEPQASAPDTRGRFFYQALQALHALTQNNSPLLLAIDDLQWANGSTLNLFGFLATRLRHLPVLLLGTVQSADAIPSLQRLITLGRRHGELQLLTLTSLPPPAVKALLHDAGLSAASVTTLAEWLYDRSGGSPFVIGEILSQLRADSILISTHDEWRLDAGRWLRWRATFTLPETAHDLVAWRLANLTPIAQRVLDVLAVAGRPLHFALLSHLPEFNAEQLIAVLDDLVSRRLVVESGDEAYALPHHLLRETLLHRISHIRRRMIHRLLAEAYESRLETQADVIIRPIALHAVAGEDIARARRFGLQVLNDLPQDYSAAETVGFFQQLYDLLVPTASRDEMLRLTQALGQLHYSLGHVEAATYWQRRHLDIAREAGDLSAQAAVCFEMSELALVTGDHLSAVTNAETGLMICPKSNTLAITTQAGRGHRLLGAALAMEGRDLPGAEAHLREALAAHRQTNQPADLCATLFELGNVAAQRGQLNRALDYYADAARTAEAGHVYYYLALAHNNLAYHHLLLGELGAARRYAEYGLKLAETYEMLGVLLYLYSTQGEIDLYQAEWPAASEMFQRGLSLAEELNHVERQAGYRAGLALVARSQNDLDRALTLLEEGLALIAGQGYLHLRARLQIWLAEILLQSGRTLEAQPYLELALTTAREHGRALLLIQAERLRAQLLAANGDWPPAEALFAEVVRRAEDLDLPLEAARTQAVWGAAILRSSPTPELGHPLLSEARATFAAHDAHADLEALQDFLAI